MRAWILVAAIAALAALVPVAAANERVDSLQLGVAPAQATITTVLRLDGSDASGFRQYLDQHVGNMDGTVTQDEVDAYQASQHYASDVDNPQCLDGFALVKVGGLAPQRLSETRLAVQDALGATGSTDPLLERWTSDLMFREPSAASVPVEMRFSTFDPMHPGLRCQPQGAGAPPTSFHTSVGTPEPAAPDTTTWSVEPQGCGRFGHDSVQPAPLQSLWDGRGLWADTPEERDSLNRSVAVLALDCPGGAQPLAASAAKGGWNAGWFVAGGIGLAAVAAGVGTEVGRYRLVSWLLALPGFTRLVRSEVLEHDRRDEIFQLIQTSPGLSLADIRRGTELSHGVLIHHVRVLEQQRFVKVLRDRFRTRFYPFGPRVEPTPYMTPAQRRILDVVRSAPGLGQAELATRVGMPQRAVAYQAKRLAESGQLRVIGNGRGRQYHPGTNLAAQT